MNTILIVIAIIAIITAVVEGIYLSKTVASKKQSAADAQAAESMLVAEKEKLTDEFSQKLEKATSRSSRLEKELREKTEEAKRLEYEFSELKKANGCYDEAWAKTEDLKKQIQSAKDVLEQTVEANKAAEVEAEAKIADAKAQLEAIKSSISEAEDTLKATKDEFLAVNGILRPQAVTDSLQAKIKLLQQQIKATKKTGHIAKSVFYTLSNNEPEWGEKRLCTEQTNFIFVGFSDDGNILFGYPIANAYSEDALRRSYYSYSSTAPEAYGIFIEDEAAEGEIARLEGDIAKHHPAQVVLLARDTNDIEIDENRNSVTIGKKMIKCGCKVNIMIASSQAKTWHQACGWNKGAKAQELAEKLEAMFNETQQQLEEIVAKDNELFTAEALLTEK